MGEVQNPGAIMPEQPSVIGAESMEESKVPKEGATQESPEPGGGNSKNGTVLDVLKGIYKDADSGYKFAEAKNVMLVGFNTAFLAAFANLAKDMARNEFPTVECRIACLIFSITFVCISLVIILFTFIPDLGMYVGKTGKKGPVQVNVTPDNTITEEQKKEIEEVNLLFYRSAEGEDPGVYIQKLYYRYEGNADVKLSDIDSIELDYAREIIYNAGIAARKYFFFKVALILDIAAAVLALWPLAFLIGS